jgi:hypothetical protein
LACTAPAAAIAALIPQIDTADASNARNRSSSPSRPPSHPREEEDDADQDQGLRDRRARGRHDHREVDRCTEQHEAGLDEELGAEPAGEPLAQAEAGEHDVPEQPEHDRVHRVFDRGRDAAERGALRRGRNGLFEEARQRGERDDDRDAGECSPKGGVGPGGLPLGGVPTGDVWAHHGTSQPGSRPVRTRTSRTRPTTVAAQSSLREARPDARTAGSGSGGGVVDAGLASFAPGLGMKESVRGSPVHRTG